jgi:hypothetical protein
MHIGLLFNDAELETIRAKVGDHRWAENGCRRLKSQADQIFIGDRPANSTLNALEAAAIYFSITGDDEHISHVQSLLERSGSFPDLFGTVSASTYDFGCNTLATGHRLPHLCIVLDLLWDMLSDSVKDHIANGLIRPAVNHLRSNDRRDSNWQTAHSTGLLAAGLVLADGDVSDFALNDPGHGLIRHMTTSFLSDGLHWEGSFGYHWGTLRNLLLSAEMVRHTGVDLYSEGGDNPYIKKMLDVPIRMAFPDRSLPVNNDAGQSSLGNLHQHYELAYARYQDPAYGWVLEGSDRASLYALLYGEPELSSEAPDSRSTTLKQSGWTSLKSIEGPNYWDSKGMAVVLDHGPHGDWHGHPDKLGIELFADGLKWIGNEGSPVGYHCQQHWEYFRRTLAHNTVVVDFKDQHFVRAGDDVYKDLEHTGELENCALGESIKTVSASVKWVYEGVDYRRTLSLEQDGLKDQFELSSDESHTYDYILHGKGTIEPVDAEMVADRLPQTTGGYEYFVNTTCLVSDEDFTVVFKDGGWPDGRFVPTGKELEITIVGAPETEFWTGYAPSHLAGVFIPFLLVRRCEMNTTFFATIGTN